MKIPDNNNNMHPEAPVEATSLRDDLNKWFSLDKVQENDLYIIPLPERTAKALAYASPITARKLIDCGKINRFKDENGVEYYGIGLTKRYGLTNRETMALQTGLSGKALADYFDLRANLLTVGYEEKEVDELLSNPKNYDKLSSDQKEIAFNVLKEAQATGDKDLADVTGVISSRLTSSWQMEDTLNLPENLFKELLSFLNHERNQWEGYEEASPKNTEELTITAEKLTT